MLINFELLINRIEQISSIIGLLVLLIGLLGGLREFWKWITYPRIKLIFETQKTFHRRRTFDQRGQDIGESMWIHLFANNDSKTTFKNCRAYLTGLWIKLNDKFVRPENFHSKLLLQWAHTTGKTSQELIDGESAGIDLFTILMRNPCLEIATDTKLPSGTLKSLYGGEYVVEVRCYADNAKEGKIRLKIQYNGEYAVPNIDVLNR